MRGKKDFAAAKRELLLLCAVAYTVSYLCRTNLSLVLDSLISYLGITKSAAGFLGTAFFWTYALGQLVSGWLGGRYSPKIIITAGLVLSGAANLAIGFCASYPAILALWLLNGMALSLLWSPIVGIASQWFAPEEYTRISILLNLPTTVGYFISWGALGPVNSLFGWRPVFWLPAAVAWGFSIVWAARVQNKPEDAGYPTVAKPPASAAPGIPDPGRPPLWRILCTFTMVTFAILALVQGSTRESINLWAPTMLHDTGAALPEWAVSGGLLLIPLFSTAGLLVTGRIFRRFQEGFDGVFLALLAGGALFGWICVGFHGSFAVSLLTMGGMMGVLYGTSAVLTTLIPLRFAATGRCAEVTGILNFLCYVGAAFGGFLSGGISDRWGWESVYFLWAMLGTLALAVMALSMWLNRRRLNRPSERMR